MFAFEVPKLRVQGRSNGRVRRVRHAKYVAYVWHTFTTAGRLPGRYDITHEIRVDPKTEIPFYQRSTEHDLTEHEITNDVIQRVIRRHTLPDTAANRRFLVLRGPTR